MKLYTRRDDLRNNATSSPSVAHRWYALAKVKSQWWLPSGSQTSEQLLLLPNDFWGGGGCTSQTPHRESSMNPKKKEKEKKNISPMKVRQWRAKYDTLSISDQNPVSKTPNDSSFHPPSTNSSTICERLFALEDLVLTDWILIRIILICKTQLGRGNRYLSPPTTTHLTSSQRTQRGFTA